MTIHQSAIISPKADISSSAFIGPNVIVEENTRIGNNVKIMANAYICKNTTIDDDCVIHMGAVLGNTPQDLAFKDGETFVSIGKGNVIREYATIHRGTKDGTSTIIGNNNFIMATAHVGHNCMIGNNTIIANGALLAGYVTVEDFAFISGNVVIHQFCRIGKLSIIGGFSGVNKDVPPFMSVRGPSVVWSINLVGLRRARISKDSLYGIKDAYNIFYKSDLNTKQAIEKIRAGNPCEEVKYFVDFIEKSKRGVCKYRFGQDDSGYFNENGQEDDE